MLNRSLSSSLRHATAILHRPRISPAANLRSVSFFTAFVGLGACPKPRRKQSNAETGEDAYFVNTANKDSAIVWAGVFDGVGGWADSGVDPSVFSASLAAHCDEATVLRPDASPVQVLAAGYEAVQRDSGVKMGSSTACIASLNVATGMVQLANLGDSGYLIVSSLTGEVVHASRPQTYFFNAPYQLAKMPDAMRRPGSLENRPSDAALSQHRLKSDQVVILATDGFFDNVFPSDAATQVAAIASRAGAVSKQVMVKDVAQALTETAQRAGKSRKNGPFAEEAKAHRMRYEGGKEDDICLIVMALDDALTPSAKL